MMSKKITTEEKLEALRSEMKTQGLSGFLLPRADEFQGEFVAPYAERLAWLTGFTGSGGLAIVLEDRAVVLTDGRYMIQVRQQVDERFFETGNFVKYPEEAWLVDHAPKESVIGYDPWLHTPNQIEKLQEGTKLHGLKFKPLDSNLVDQIWQEQPERPKGPVEVFPVEIAGVENSEKRALVAASIEKNGGFCSVLTLPDSICWLLNVRGSDIDYVPSVLSYAVVYGGSGDVQWFVDPDKMTGDVRAHIGANVAIVDIKQMQGALKEMGESAKESRKPVLLDYKRAPLWFKATLEKAGVQTQDCKDPCIAPKAIKTPAEQEALKEAHVRDGVALVQFLFWLENESLKGALRETDIGEKLLELRAQNAAFRGESFATIAGFAGNGAIVHYHATPGNDSLIEPPGLLLVDSGAQYNGGTTDITRTVAIGEPTLEMKENFTRVLKGHIAVASARFPAGTVGAQIDALARRPLWDAGLDYAHGTGHGVGCYLAVHEEAASLSPRGQEALKPGMLISNEPGYYKEGAYGIRIENLVLVQKEDEGADGRDGILCFETVSLAPLDGSLILGARLSPEELLWLNSYHARIYDTLAPLLGAEEKAWLFSKTREIFAY